MTFWDNFYSKPIDQIPWSKTQADWFVELVEQGTLAGASALDVGCGLGAKSIFLATHGFSDVVGVDIAPRAVQQAHESAVDAGVESACSFYTHDASDLSFLPSDTQFDLVLDWATLHCIPKAHRDAYARGIADRVRNGGLLLVRTFTAEDGRGSFEEETGGQKETVYLSTEADIRALYPEFDVVARNTSKPRTKTDLQFLELLLRKVR